MGELIYDVGMHVGQDTRYYLDQGHRVVAVEANPRLYRQARKTFRQEIADGRLTIVEAAIAERAGTVEFLLFRDEFVFFRDQRYRWRDAWGTLDNHFAHRNVAEYGLKARRIKVRAVTFDSILREHGVPHYLKLDIEGSELPCVTALRLFAERPIFLSLEIDYIACDRAHEALEELVALGYSRFKVIPQADHGPEFEVGSSGPFGDGTVGDWLSPEDIRLLFAERLSELDWHDLHARR